MSTKTTAAPQWRPRGWRLKRSRYLEIPVQNNRAIALVLSSERNVFTFAPRSIFGAEVSAAMGQGRFDDIYLFDDRFGHKGAEGHESFDYWTLSRAVRRSGKIIVVSRHMSEVGAHMLSQQITIGDRVTIISTTEAWGDEWLWLLNRMLKRQSASVVSLAQKTDPAYKYMPSFWRSRDGAAR
jgi:hypothetical protein